MRRVLISGGSRGIGAETVKQFTAIGDRVGFLYAESEKSAQELAALTGALPYRADLRDKEAVQAAVKEFGDAYGGVDILVNCAGIAQIKMFCDITEDDWSDMFTVNVTGAYRVTQAALPYMVARKYGSIINISSMWGLVGASCEVHYSASKSAVIGMTKALAKELGLSGITVNCICPGVIDTDMNASLGEQDRKDLCEQTPLGRIGSSAEVASLIRFLASDEARFITGQAIAVDGGFSV